MECRTCLIDLMCTGDKTHLSEFVVVVFFSLYCSNLIISTVFGKTRALHWAPVQFGQIPFRGESAFAIRQLSLHIHIVVGFGAKISESIGILITKSENTFFHIWKQQTFFVMENEIQSCKRVAASSHSGISYVTQSRWKKQLFLSSLHPKEIPTQLEPNISYFHQWKMYFLSSY